MCQVGDIIVVENYEKNGVTIMRHSFVVINDEADEIQGLDYDLVCNVMSSFKDEEHKKRKLKHRCNVQLTSNDVTIENGGNEAEGYIKADQFFYFSKAKTKIRVIGSLKPDAISELISRIIEMDYDIKSIIDNL